MKDAWKERDGGVAAVQFAILDQCAPMVGGGQHTSAPSGACTASGGIRQLHRSPPAAAAAQRGQVVQRDRIRCDAERQQRVGLLVDAAAAKHSPKKARSGAVAAESLFPSPTSRCPETLFNTLFKPRQ